MTNQRKGIASLASIANSDDDFSVIDAIGGVRGVVESMLPGLVFVVTYLVSSNVQLTVIISAVLAVLLVVARIVQRQTVMGSFSGLIAVGICLVWVWTSHEARNYYVFGFMTNAVYAVLLVVSLLCKAPGVGLMVEWVRSTPMSHFKMWLNDWRNDHPLLVAYTRVTWLWIVLFVVRLVVQVPLYATNNVAALGISRLIMGIPLWAAAIWVSYLIVGTPLIRHGSFMPPDNDVTQNGELHNAES